jgi:hypothetical protein
MMKLARIPLMRDFLAQRFLVFSTLPIIALGCIGCGGGGGGNENETHYWNTEILVPFGSHPMPSPNGQWIAFGGTGDSIGIWVYDMTQDTVVRLTDGTHPHRWDYRWMPDSQTLVFGGAGEFGTATAGIWLVSCPQAILTRASEFGGDPDPDPSGQSVCFAGISSEDEESGIWVIGILIPQIDRLKPNGEHPRFSPDGNWITYLIPSIPGAPELHIMNHLGGNERFLIDSIMTQEWLDNETLICLSPGDIEVDIVKVTAGATAQVSNVAHGGSQFDLCQTEDMIVYQSEENGYSIGLAVTSSLGSGNRLIVPSGAYPRFFPGSGDIVFEDSGGILKASE